MEYEHCWSCRPQFGLAHLNQLRGTILLSRSTLFKMNPNAFFSLPSNSQHQASKPLIFFFLLRPMCGQPVWLVSMEVFHSFIFAHKHILSRYERKEVFITACRITRISKPKPTLEGRLLATSNSSACKHNDSHIAQFFFQGLNKREQR